MQIPRIIFIHIPKTGGTTLQSLIRKQFEREEEYYIEPDNIKENVKKFCNLPLHDKEKYKYVRGHFFFGIHEYIPEPYTYLTLLRDPVEQIVSHYFFAKRTASNAYYDLINEDNWEIIDFVKHKTRIDNIQTRSLAGLSKQYDKNKIVPPAGKLTEAHFKKAKENINQFFGAIGILEQFEEFIFVLNKKFNWNIQQNYEILNSNPNKKKKYIETIDKPTLDFIQKHNYFDIKLYEYVKTKFF